MIAEPIEKGSLLRWLHRRRPRDWGADPGAFDPAAVAETMAHARRWFGDHAYFRLHAEGLEHIPPPPVMLVSNHSGGTSIPDVWGFMVAWYRRFGVERPLHPMAHEMILATDVTGRYFTRRGVLRADREVGRQVLERWGRDLLVMPGGELDTWRPFTQRWRVRFGGRTGYARLAIEARVPIVPVAHAGAHETLIVLTDGQWLARKLRLPAIARASIFPIHLSLPWGLAVGPWPHLPVPARLRYRVGAPISPPEVGLGESPTEAQVRALDQRVQQAVQVLLDQLHAA